MINRVLIRLKIVQIVYAYYQNGGKNLDTAEKELFFSLSKAYDLYNYLLLLMVEVTKQAIQFIAEEQGPIEPHHTENEEQETTEDAHKPLSPNEIKIDIDF